MKDEMKKRVRELRFHPSAFILHPCSYAARSTDVRLRCYRTGSCSDRIKDSTCVMESVPSAVADGSRTRFDTTEALVLSPAKAGSGFIRDVIPGLRSLRSLTRGYNHAAATRLVDADIQVDAVIT